MIYNLKEQIKQIEDIKQRLAALEAAAKEQPDVLPPQTEPAMPHRLNLNHVGMQVEGWDDGDKVAIKGVLWGIDYCCDNAGCKYMIDCDDPGYPAWTQHARLVTGIHPDEYTAAGPVLHFAANPQDEYRLDYGHAMSGQDFASFDGRLGLWSKEYVIADEQPHLEEGGE